MYPWRGPEVVIAIIYKENSPKRLVLFRPNIVERRKPARFMSECTIVKYVDVGVISRHK